MTGKNNALSIQQSCDLPQFSPHPSLPPPCLHSFLLSRPLPCKGKGKHHVWYFWRRIYPLLFFTLVQTALSISVAHYLYYCTYKYIDNHATLDTLHPQHGAKILQNPLLVNPALFQTWWEPGNEPRVELFFLHTHTHTHIWSHVHTHAQYPLDIL